MRKGMNPNRQKEFTGTIPPNVPVVAVVVHLPSIKEAYHKNRLEIVDASLKTARKHAGCDHALVVWDNGSNAATKKLVSGLNPDILVTSPNIGKLNAWKHLLKMYSDCVISIADDDILYYPNWLVEQIRVLEAYSKHPYSTVASVTGVVTRQNATAKISASLKWANDYAELNQEGTIPNEWDVQHGMSCGRDRESARKYMASRHIPDVRYNGVKARICGGHTQFTCYGKTISEIIPYTDKLMMTTFPLFDAAVDSAGWLKLSTYDRTSRHLGNVLLDEDRAEIEELLK